MPSNRKTAEDPEGSEKRTAAGRERSGRRRKTRLPFSSFSFPQRSRRRSEQPPGIPRGCEQAATKELGASRGRDSFAGATPARGAVIEEDEATLLAANVRRGKRGN